MKVGDRIANRYEVEDLLGSGGMSSVFRAFDTGLERRVALKVLHEHFSDDPEYVERFRREAQAIARLSHPNIVTVIDRGEYEGRQFIVFEHVAGENLKELVEREGPLAVPQALALTHQVARGLAFAHEHGIVHRDVKPQNVLVNDDGAVKVTDFGIARSLERDEGLTMTGTLLGTSDYIAPEQARGEPVDERSDQYSLGVLLYELLTGCVPYEGENFMTVAVKHLRDPVPSLRGARPDVSPRVEAVVRRAMAKRPEDRFPSTEALIAALETCMAEERAAGARDDGRTEIVTVAPPEATTPPTRTDVVRPAPTFEPPAAPARPRRRGRRSVVGAALVAFAVGGAALVLVLTLRGGGGGATQADAAAAGGGARSVELTAVHDYDPAGDQQEHPTDVPKATDGNQATFWTTETYRSFQKPGVGLVLDARRPVVLTALTVTSDEPGWTAVIRASSSETGGFTDVSASRTAASRTLFRIDTRGQAYRYYLLWITNPNGRAHVNEVQARAAAT